VLFAVKQVSNRHLISSSTIKMYITLREMCIRNHTSI